MTLRYVICENRLSVSGDDSICLAVFLRHVLADFQILVSISGFYVLIDVDPVYRLPVEPFHSDLVFRPEIIGKIVIRLI